MMVAMIQYNPELAKSTPSDVSPSTRRPGSVYAPLDTPSAAARTPSVSSRRSLYGALSNGDFNGDATDIDDDDIQVGHHFTYIPPNPKRFYKRLLEICLIADLEVMLSPEVDDNDEVSLGILSAPHIDLLNECAVRWRIGHSYRAACFLDLVRQFYERGDVPLECIPEGLQNIAKAMNDLDLEKWPTQDVRLLSSPNVYVTYTNLPHQSEYLSGIYGNLFNIFLSSLYHAMDDLVKLKPSDIEPYMSVLEHVRDSGLLERFDVDINVRLSDVQERIRQVAVSSMKGRCKS